MREQVVMTWSSSTWRTLFPKCDGPKSNIWPARPADGAGIIIVSSEAEEAARLCSKVHFMRDGAIVQTLSRIDVTEAAVSRAVVEGEAETATANVKVETGAQKQANSNAAI